MNENGASTVDYTLLSNSILNGIAKLSIFKKLRSDHS